MCVRSSFFFTKWVGLPLCSLKHICIAHLNWILKTAGLTESWGTLDERPVKSGGFSWGCVGNGVNPQTRQSDRQTSAGADDGDAFSKHPPASLTPSHMYEQRLERRWGGFDKINKIESTESDYNHTTIVRNKLASWCFCGGAIRVLVHF